MNKESFFINVQGHPFGDGPLSGTNTHMRGEGKWMLNVALNMARHGHDVTILAYGWCKPGDENKYPLPKNISLQREFKGECDIFMDSGWDDATTPQRYKDIKAKCYIHGWHGDPSYTTFIKYKTDHNQTDHNLKNHFIGGMSRCFKYYCDKYPFSLYAPIPVVDKIKSMPNIYSKKMLWANKGAFHIAYYKYSEQILEFMERHQHQDYKYTVIFYEDIVERANNEIKRPDIVERFEKLQDNNHANLIGPYSGITNDKFIEELDNSIFLLDNGQPSAHPQSIEALCMGCVPLLWKVGEHQHHFQTKDYKNVSEKFGLECGLDSNNDKLSNIEKLLDNKDLHIEYYNALKEVMTDHEFDSAYEILMNEIYNKMY